MELYHYLLIALGVIVIGVILFLIFRKKTPQTKSYDMEAITSLLDKNNIESISFIRNKIVINFSDVTKFNAKMLHENGALGINIIGDKVKFYFDGGNEKNEIIYKEIKKYIER